MSLAFNKKISVYDAAQGRDSKGFTTRDWTGTQPVKANIPASIQQLSARQVEVYGRRGVDADVEIITRGNPAAKKGMRIPDPDDGTIFYTVVDTEDMAGRGRFFSIACKRVK